MVIDGRREVGASDGRRAVVTAGTTSERLLRAWNETHGGRIQLLSARDHGEAFQSLETGKVDALMLDDALLLLSSAFTADRLEIRNA